MSNWLNSNTANTMGDPFGIVGQLGQGGTWYDPMNIFGTGPGKPLPPNPADSAMGYFDQVPGTIKPYYDPYINAGRDALGTLQGQYNTLVNDPNAIINKFGSQFQKSPGYQFQMNEAMNGANNAAASGGMLGTPYHQKNAASLAGNIANQDYYNFLNNSLGMYGKGLEGYQGLNQMGYGASDALASGLAANLMNQGQLAYQGQQAQNEAQQGKDRNQSQMLGSILGLGSSLFGGFL